MSTQTLDIFPLMDREGKRGWCPDSLLSLLHRRSVCMRIWQHCFSLCMGGRSRLPAIVCLLSRSFFPSCIFKLPAFAVSPPRLALPLGRGTCPRLRDLGYPFLSGLGAGLFFFTSFFLRAFKMTEEKNVRKIKLVGNSNPSPRCLGFGSWVHCSMSTLFMGEKARPRI